MFIFTVPEVLAKQQICVLINNDNRTAYQFTLATKTSDVDLFSYGSGVKVATFWSAVPLFYFASDIDLHKHNPRHFNMGNIFRFDLPHLAHSNFPAIIHTLLTASYSIQPLCFLFFFYISNHLQDS